MVEIFDPRTLVAYRCLQSVVRCILTTVALLDSATYVLAPFNSDAFEIGIVSEFVQIIGSQYHRSLKGFPEIVYNEFIIYSYFRRAKQGSLFTGHFVAFLLIIASILCYDQNTLWFRASLLELHWAHCTTGRFAFFNAVSARCSLARPGQRLPVQ